MPIHYPPIPAARPNRKPGNTAGMGNVCALRKASIASRVAGRSADRSARLSVSAACSARGRYGKALLLVLLLPLFLLGAGPALAVTPPGTSIENTAAVSFEDGTPTVVASNTVSLLSVEWPRTASTLEFLKHAPTASQAENIAVPSTAYRTGDDPATPFANLAAPSLIPSGNPIDLDAAPFVAGAIYHRGEAVFLRLTDLDQNMDRQNTETVLVTVTAEGTEDVEVLLLTETGPNTGIFVGYIQSSGQAGVPYDGLLETLEDGRVSGSYVDAADGSDIAATASLFDPFGIIFDSRTGQPVDGATVTLMNTATGAPAVVYGDDGVSLYPAQLVSGGSTTDSAGNVYTFPPGGYRFPFMAPDSYRLEIAPPAGYAAPSTAADAELQSLPGAPYALVIGSRGEEFQLNPGPALRIDLPIDPVAFGGVWLRKTVGKDQVAVGDFVPYRLELENPNDVPTTAIVLNDKLPVGFRYRKGSARLDGLRISDPAIAADGRNLTFALDAVAAGGRGEIRYVAEVTAGARPGKATNTAAAVTTAGIASNTAQATVLVREDFFRSTTFLMGRVFTGGCGEPETDEADGLAGARIYLEDGTYVVTDESGMFHFEGVRPGTHVVQLDLDSLPEQYEVVPCEENTRFAGRAWSQFVDLQGGALWRTDFHVGLKPRAQGEVSIELNGELDSKTETATFRIPVRTGGVPTSNLRLTLLLPEGMNYIEGSSTQDGVSFADPQAGFGNALTYNLGDFAAGQQAEVSFRCDIRQATPGDHTARALLTFDSPQKKNQRTPMAENSLRASLEISRLPLPEFTVRPHFPSLGTELSPKDRQELEQLAKKFRLLDIHKLIVVGHTDNVPIAPASRHLFADNFALSEARAKSVAHCLGDSLDLPPAKLVLVGLGDADPLADNDTDEGRAVNRRVELRVEGDKIKEERKLQLTKDHSGEQRIETVGLRPGEGAAAAALKVETPAENKMPEIDKVWVEKAQPGLEWVWPQPAYGPPIPSIKAAIKHRPQDRIELLLDGQPVHPLAFEGTIANGAGTVAVSLWRGIGIQEGDNAFELIVRNADGEITDRLQRVIHYSGAPVKVALAPEHSALIADGKNPTVIAVRLVDKDGFPAREGVVGDFSIDPPYVAWEKKKSVASSVAAEEQGFRPHFQVGADGVALILLEPTTVSGEAILHFKLDEYDQEVRAWIQPQMRDWILVGLAEGTMGYNAVSGNVESLPAGAGEDLYEDGRVAFYAKGRVLGKWLLTMAYDSDKPDRKGQELFQTIDPDSYYFLYGDAGQQAYDAASAEKLYLKIEREQFYALFGDYTTGLSQTELARYSRSLTGLKSEYNGKYVTFNLFASDTNQAFVKDEIRGDGTSGLYRLSRRDIVLNSEKVTIEVRDRLRSEVILSSTPLARHLDYNIDYQAGTLFFKEPIASQDEAFNPVFIVIDYETATTSNTALNYGGRAAVRLPEQKLEVGVTAIHEDLNNSEGDLYGLDATWALTAGTELRGEIAASESQFAADSRSGKAWLAELEHHSARFAALTYYREMEEGFGLGQQSGSEEGTRKFGVDGTYKLGTMLNLGGEIYRQMNLETDAVRDVAQSDLTYTAKRYSLSAGLRHAVDDFADGVQQKSTQALLGATWQAFDRLLLRVAREQSILGNNGSSDFPSRTLLGADYKLNESAILFAAQEWTDGDDVKSSGTRVGLKTVPWRGGKFDSALEQQINEYGPRMFALFGLGQTLQLDDRWSIDASLDRNQTVRKAGARQFDTDVPPVVDGEDFTAVSIGASYREEKWAWENRLEYRTADTEDRWGIFSGIVGEVREGLALSGRAQIFLTDTGAGAENTKGELSFGLAHRPRLTRWIVLDRLDYIFDENIGDNINLTTWRLVNNLNANYKLDKRTQIALQYGAKYVKDDIDEDDYSSFTDLFGIEGRYDLTKNWDIGLRSSVLHSWSTDAFDYSAGASVGYNVMKNAWVSLGYNLIGFEDADFSRANFTAEGPYVKFRVKFDQNSVRDALKSI